ncbi:MAG: lytic murein transglycosylase [bacterium]|nr:lytic murein transglycosylase [bacterium]
MRFFGVFLLSLAAFSAFAEPPDPSTVLQRRAQLEAELAGLEKEIEGFQNVIQAKQSEAQSLERDISLLDAQIKKAKLEIKARVISISNLQGAIGAKTRLIGALQIKIEREKDSLGELIRQLDELDKTTLVEALLAYHNLSDFFVETDSFDAVNQAVQDSFEKIRLDKNEAEVERDDLEERKGEEVQLRALQELERKRIEEREAEKKRILTATRGQEKVYQKLLEERAKNAATLRSQLFILNGSPSIPFEKALEYAALAEKTTGVRPAFLLGIIAEESNLGANVGTGNWKTDLSHSRCAKQRTAFQDITSRLGLNPDLMPVSRKAWYGYCGGAMGPAQFIPTTWLLYENAIVKITSHNPPNPWDPKDAFVASALLLKDNGAAARTYQAENRAALRYLAGSNWQKPAYRFYGDDVMALASKYQEQIDILKQFAGR